MNRDEPVFRTWQGSLSPPNALEGEIHIPYVKLIKNTHRQYIVGRSNKVDYLLF